MNQQTKIAIEKTLHCELLYGKKQLRCCMERKFYVLMKTTARILLHV